MKVREVIGQIEAAGLGVAGRTREEVETLARKAIDLYLEELRDQGLEIPAPHHTAAFAQVA